MEPTLLSLVTIYFIIIDPIGCIPSISAVMSGFDFAHQRRILIREIVIALAIAIGFQYFGEWFLNTLNIQDYVLRIAGGILLLIVSLQMIFAIVQIEETSSASGAKPKKEPYIFPIACPLLTGPGVLTMTMVQARALPSWKLTLAICLAWIPVFIVLMAAPYLQKLLKKIGLVVLEQVIGMLLAMLSIEMISNGFSIFIKSL